MKKNPVDTQNKRKLIMHGHVSRASILLPKTSTQAAASLPSPPVRHQITPPKKNSCIVTNTSLTFSKLHVSVLDTVHIPQVGLLIAIWFFVLFLLNFPIQIEGYGYSGLTIIHFILN